MERKPEQEAVLGPEQGVEPRRRPGEPLEVGGVAEIEERSELDFPVDSFDLIVSSITIHHLKHHQKELLFKKAFSWLSNAGVFTYSDQFGGETKEIYDNHMNLWHQFVLNSGCTEDEWHSGQYQRNHSERKERFFPKGRLIDPVVQTIFTQIAEIFPQGA